MSYDCPCIDKVLTSCGACGAHHIQECYNPAAVSFGPCEECNSGDIAVCGECAVDYELEHEKGCSLAIIKESPLKKQKLSGSDDEDDGSGPIKCKVRGCKYEADHLCKACDEAICIYHGGSQVGDSDDNLVCDDCSKDLCGELRCYAKGIHPCKNCKTTKMCDEHMFTFKTTIGNVGFYCTKCIKKAKKIVETVKKGSLSDVYLNSCCKSKNCSDRIKHWCIKCSGGVCFDHASSCDDDGNIICEACDEGCIEDLKQDNHLGECKMKGCSDKGKGRCKKCNDCICNVHGVYCEDGEGNKYMLCSICEMGYCEQGGCFQAGFFRCAAVGCEISLCNDHMFTYDITTSNDGFFCKDCIKETKGKKKSSLKECVSRTKTLA